MKTAYQTLRQSVKSAQGASYWLKAAVEALHQRDPVDAASDAETLLYMCKARLAELGVPS